MKFDNFTKSVKLAASKIKFKGKQYSPEILLAMGIATGVAAVGIAVYQSITKTPFVIDETKVTIEQIHGVTEKQEKYGLADGEEQYTKEDRKKDLAIVYIKTSAKLLKIYAPAIILEVVSITSILASNNIIKSRNAALASAYAAVDRTFKDYRNRVIEELGEEADNRFRYNIKAKTIERTEVNEDGEAITKRETVEVAEVGDNDIYSFWFNEDCYGWDEDPVIAKSYLRGAIKSLNNVFHARGFLFLNDIYKYFGLPMTQAGQVIGWIDNPGPNELTKCIDFGITDKKHYCANADFLGNSSKSTCLISLNPDGPILNYLDEK